MEDWCERARELLAKVKEQKERTALEERQTSQITQNHASSNGALNGNNAVVLREAELLDKLAKLLERSVREREEEQIAEEQESMHRHLGLYGTWTGGAALKAARKKRKLSQGSESALGQAEGEANSIVGMAPLEMDAIEEEEPREEMDWPKSDQFSEIETTGQKEEWHITGAVETVEHGQEPWPIRVILHFALFSCTIAYLLLAAQIFRWLDPEIGAKVFPKALVWTFQLATTIGWGDSKAVTSWSQAFTVLYVLFAIPMIFACFANLGRLATEFACIGWPRIKSWLLRRPFERKEHRLPLLSALNFLCLHQCLGIFLYSHWLKQWPVMSTVYYSITTMATIGFGDFHPDTDHWGETIIALLYLSTGITLLSMLFLTIAFHFQCLHYEKLKEFLEFVYKNVWPKFCQRLRGKRKEEEQIDGKHEDINNNP